MQRASFLLASTCTFLLVRACTHCPSLCHYNCLNVQCASCLHIPVNSYLVLPFSLSCLAEQRGFSKPFEIYLTAICVACRDQTPSIPMRRPPNLRGSHSQVRRPRANHSTRRAPHLRPTLLSLFKKLPPLHWASLPPADDSRAKPPSEWLAIGTHGCE